MQTYAYPLNFSVCSFSLISFSNSADSKRVCPNPPKIPPFSAKIHRRKYPHNLSLPRNTAPPTGCSFGFNFIVADHHAEIFHSLFVREGITDFCSSARESTVLVFAVFDFSPKPDASINTTSSLLALSINKIETLVPVVAKILEGMDTTPASILFSTRCSRIFLSMPDWAVIKPVGNTIAALPFSFRLNKICWIKAGRFPSYPYLLP